MHLDGVVADFFNSWQDGFREVAITVDLALNGRDSNVTFVDF